MKVHKMIVSIAVLVAVIVTPHLCDKNDPANSTMTPMTPTSDVTITATPTWIYTGLTQHLTINCSFQAGNASDFKEIMSLIVSKSSDYDQSVFNEVAIITLHSGDIVEVKDTALGAHVTGHMPLLPGDAYLLLEWVRPNASVLGEYKCDAFGMDNHGHPRDRQVSLEVADNEITKDSCMAEVTNLVTSEGNILDQMSSLSSLLMANSSSVYGAHRYLLSTPMERNITRAEGICESLGGYLAEIQDTNEYDFVFNFAMLGNGVKKLALGVTDEGHENQWTFIHSGGPAFIHNRFDGNSGTRYNCMELWNYGGHRVGMDDQPCFGRNTYDAYSQGQFLCEVPM